MHIMDYRVANTTFDRNANAKSNVENREDCHICGKGVNRNTCTTWVEVDTDGTLIEVGVEDADSQGCFPVGPECAKKIDKKYLQILNPIG
jgi:hypothetical protein